MGGQAPGVSASGQTRENASAGLSLPVARPPSLIAQAAPEAAVQAGRAGSGGISPLPRRLAGSPLRGAGRSPVRRAPLRNYRCAYEHCSLPRGVHAPLQGAPRVPPPPPCRGGARVQPGPASPCRHSTWEPRRTLARAPCPGGGWGSPRPLIPAPQLRGHNPRSLARGRQNAGVSCRRGVGCEGAGAPGERPRGTAGEGNPPRHLQALPSARPPITENLLELQGG